MKYGDRGPVVAALQRALISRGHSVGAAGADGILGPATWRALEAVAGRPLDRAEPVPPALLTSVHNEMPPEPGWHETRGEELPSQARRGRPSMIVGHESVTDSTERTVEVLRARGLGVQYIIAPDAAVTQHVSEERACYHAGIPRINDAAVAIEIVNLYYGHRARPGDDTLRGVWVDIARQEDGTIRNPDKVYIIPPLVQLEAAYGLARRIVDRQPGIVDGAALFPCKESFFWGRLKAGQTAGLSAHHRWGNADFLFPEHYIQCRWRSLDPAAAYLATIASAASGKRHTKLPGRHRA